MLPPTATITEIREAIASRSVRASAVVEGTLGRIAEHNPALNAVLEVFGDEAMALAADLDRRLRDSSEPMGPLAGVPILVKDNICLDRGKTTCGSRMLAGYSSPFSATAVQRLEEAGAIIVGKTNMDEFAMGSSGEHSYFGPTGNPYDTARVPGGSSSGSAAAIGARLTPVALGSDTGGSIRQPASYTGCVGLKPTYGRVSRWGLVAYASSLDQIGPITTTVSDAAIMLDVLAGFDPLDATSAEMEPVHAFVSVERPIEGLRLGVPREAGSQANDESVRTAFNRAMETFRSLGAEVVDFDLPTLDAAISTYYLVAMAEASSNLARFDGIRYGHRATLKEGEGLEALYARSRSEGFGAEVQRRIMLGCYALSSGYYDDYYLTALKARRRMKQDFDRAFGAGLDAIVMPTAPDAAFPIGEKSDDPLAMYLEDIYTVSANLAGLPAISLPMGTATTESGKHLPLGLQLIAPAFEEVRLLRIARMFERASSPIPLPAGFGL
ncbi:MAG: Asp-tRNA(Asn)/Glu-tRNA(Gln) amidotransferase subunit GatA [Phycisphaeraceae bacterium]|nr:MAG: Asp-tRNA(Asn)/Glu-tRNA(Gln) amidotransferase subunit GatA [Phycisphaeraceae bacterium]